MRKEERGNQTAIAEFVLLGFGSRPDLQHFLFLLFLVIYMVTVSGNILIVVLVVTDRHLHTPMYFFLGNLSFLESCYSSTLLPRLLASFLTGDGTISVTGCLVQFYWFGFLATAECYLLAVMAYDRYLAICTPLRYAAFMSRKFCMGAAFGSWLSSLTATSLIVCFVSELTFCRPKEMDHFFCDLVPLLKHSCEDATGIMLLSFILTSVDALSAFLLTAASYGRVIATILKIPSTAGKQKAFSTCSSHLTVVTVFYGTITIVYMLPDVDALRDLNKVFSIFYTVLTPLVNPLIYSLRNKEVQKALRKVFSKYLAFTCFNVPG